QVVIEPIAPAPAPRELLLEASYADPNGEVQTLRSTQTLWPSQVVAGLKTDGWASVGQKIRFQALALDLSGKAQADVAVEVKAISRITTTSRKRMVGGFYTYDNKTETKDLGTVCSGKSDSRGLVLCEAKLAEPGQVELVATAKDSQGRPSVAATSVYVTRQGELWFGGEDHDRIDLLPEKKNYQPGEVAKFQVRMPFRFATALVSVEREGVIETQVVQLNGQDPTVQLQVKESWGPNVFVSVLALRGRLREVPWYSFFTWGFKSPREWWTAFWWEGREYVAPTAMVDLSKPAYRLGAAEIRVGSQAHQIALKVASDQPSYTVRGQAQVTITGTLPDGKPAANAEVAVAVVDQALLELMPNTSWILLDAMLTRRSWGVATSTAQMEIVGRRHYGRKAVPAGGGGGKSATRELLDTLLLWNPRVVLDANGQAKLTVPLNDALTTFRIAAVAESGTGLFGTGTHSIQTTQDLQIISGLPPLVREDDEFRAQVTLRNTTAKAMKVEAAPRATLLTLAPQTVDIPAGEAREVAWTVKAPAQLAATRAEAILWQIEARDLAGNDKARDSLKVSQRIVPAVPVTVQQANLVQLDATPFKLDVAPPAGALPGRGGLRLALQSSLGSALPGVRDWFVAYPYSCLEQKTSKALGLRDAKMWRSVVAQMPAYLDGNGLASYFPPREGSADSGSDTLTAYLLAVTSEAAALDPALALPDELRAQMEAGLLAFVEGRIERKFWSPRQD
ncbi:MAG TPA: alpha-2-macroglobulin family protein, partial [Ramlibacter sp.]